MHGHMKNGDDRWKDNAPSLQFFIYFIRNLISTIIQWGDGSMLRERGIKIVKELSLFKVSSKFSRTDGCVALMDNYNSGN